MFEWWWEFLYKISHAINQCIDALYKLFFFFAGASNVEINQELTGSLASNPLKTIFATNTVAIWFAGILGLAILVFLVSFVIAMVRTEYISKDNQEGKVKIFKASMKGAALAVLLPIIFGIAIKAITIILGGISEAMSTNENSSFAQELFDICMPDQSQPYPWDSTYKELTSLLSGHGSMHDYNFFIAYVGGIVMLFILGLAVLNLIERIIDLVFLYIISPVVIAVSPLDDGNRLGIWKDLTIAKFMSIAGMIMCFYIYFLFMNVMNNLLIGTSFLVRFTKLICAIGGALAAKKGGLLISNLVGHNTALIEGQQQGLAAQMVGTGFRAGLGVINALGHGAIHLLGAAGSKIGGAIRGSADKRGVENMSTGESGVAASATNAATSTLGAATTTFSAVSEAYNQNQAQEGATPSMTTNSSFSGITPSQGTMGAPPTTQNMSSGAGQGFGQPGDTSNAGTVPNVSIGTEAPPSVMPPISGDIQGAINSANGFNNAKNGSSSNGSGSSGK